MFGLAETMKQGSGGWQSELSQERALYPESGTSEATQQPLHTVEPGKSAPGTAVTWRKGRKRLTKKSLESRLIVSWRIHGSITFCFQGIRTVLAVVLESYLGGREKQGCFSHDASFSGR